MSNDRTLSIANLSCVELLKGSYQLECMPMPICALCSFWMCHNNMNDLATPDSKERCPLLRRWLMMHRHLKKKDASDCGLTILELLLMSILFVMMSGTVYAAAAGLY